MVLGSPHPLLVELVRRLARAAAQADHGAEMISIIVGPTSETQN